MTKTKTLEVRIDPQASVDICVAADRLDLTVSGYIRLVSRILSKVDLETLRSLEALSDLVGVDEADLLATMLAGCLDKELADISKRLQALT